MDLFSLEWWEGASYVITVIGLPMAIIVFLYEQRRERQGEEEELYQYLSEEYAEFQKLALENADLQIVFGADNVDDALEPEQLERKRILYDILISLLERTYLLVYEDKMDKKTARLWASWEDYIHQWCRRQDFRKALPEMLEGEDPEFAAYILAIAKEEAGKKAAHML